MKNNKKIPLQERSQFMVQNILEAATRILEGRVKENFTTNKIAEVAGVSIGSLYQYFKNKESIVEDLLLKRMQNSLEKIFENLQRNNQLTAENFIRVIVEEQFEQWKNRGQLSQSILKYVPKVIDPSYFHQSDEKLITFFSDKIAEFELHEFNKENLDIALKLSINTVRMSIFMLYTSTKKYDYGLTSEETIKLLTNYLLAKAE